MHKPFLKQLIRQLTRLVYFLGYRPYLRVPAFKGQNRRSTYVLIRRLTWLELKYWDILRTVAIWLDSYIRHNKPPLWGRWGILG